MKRLPMKWAFSSSMSSTSNPAELGQLRMALFKQALQRKFGKESE